MRLDKWLWVARIYRTRSQATQACRSGHVKLEGQALKPSHEVRLNEMISAQIGPVTRTLKVLGLTEQRVSATLAKNLVEDLTPPEEYEKAREHRQQPLFFRPQGLGRPTKKDRRDLNRLQD